MPSLSALGEFMSSFNNIANEKDDVTAKNLPFDNLVLPKDEAPPFDVSAARSAPAPAAESPSGAADFDFDALLNSMSDDVSPPSIDSILDDIAPASSDVDSAPAPASDSQTGAMSAMDDLLGGMDAPADDTSFLDGLLSGDSQEPESGKVPDAGADDFSVPDDLLSGLSDEIESAPPDLETPDIPADSGAEDTSFGDLGMDDLLAGLGGEDAQAEGETIDMGGESPAPGFDDLSANEEPAGSGAADSGMNDGLDNALDLGGELSHEADSQDIALPEVESAADDLDLGGSSIDLGGETPDMGAELPAAGDDLSFGDSLPEIPESDDSVSDAGIDSTLPDIDLPEFDSIPAAGNESPPGADDAGSFPLDDLGAEFASDSIELSHDADAHSEIDLGGHGFGAGDLGGDEFTLPGLEDIFEKTKIDTTAQPASKKGFFKRKKAKGEELSEIEENIDEISLTQEDVNSLLKTLSAYPLNLRIACEEIIAEQVILPQQLARLIRLLVNGAPVRETADHVEKITGKPVIIPKSFEKMTGAAFEAEQASFAYIFVHNFLPVLRLFAVIAALAASIVYLGYKFVYIPLHAESLYKRGYERIPAGEYQRANELFHDAFVLHRKKKWFYSYAEAFRDERRYMLSENKYDELLRYYPRDKKGVLDYANLETYYLMNYDKANRLLQRELLDYATNDFDGLLAAGDNFLAWADSDPSRFYDRYEDARFSYARLLENYGWQVPIVERMMKYFIRTDNLGEVLKLRVWFESGRNRNLSAESLSELGGYLLDKQLEKPSGVPNPYVESIESVRSMLLEAIRKEPTLPEPHYHLARYHNNLGNTYEERLTLENAIRAFDLAQTESVRRRLYNVDTRYRYANLLIDNKEFFLAEEQIVKGIELYEDFLSRNLISASPQLGQLYAARGDLEYFVKTGNMQAALTNYRLAERYGHSPPEIQYRMGSAYYQLEDWRNALEYIFKASSQLPLNRRVLYALGNAAYKRGDYFAAQGYYNRLLDLLESQRVRLPVLLPNDNPQFKELGERLMMARNNAAVVYEALAEQTGNREYRTRALAYYAESARAWDAITRDPETMIRMRLADNPGVPGINLGYLNANNALRPASDYRPEIFIRIDRDILEPSRWEELAPFGGMIE
jgi:tetratricopeptide (TPR) repeat protein